MLRQKLTTQLSSCCSAFWRNIYPFSMPEPPGELMTTEKFINRELNQKSSTYGHVTKLFSESEFQHKGNKRKNANSQQNHAVFSAATDSENKII